jgi:hypothetical protein
MSLTDKNYKIGYMRTLKEIDFDYLSKVQRHDTNVFNLYTDSVSVTVTLSGAGIYSNGESYGECPYTGQKMDGKLKKFG